MGQVKHLRIIFVVIMSINLKLHLEQSGHVHGTPFAIVVGVDLNEPVIFFVIGNGMSFWIII